METQEALAEFDKGPAAWAAYKAKATVGSINLGGAMLNVLETTPAIDLSSCSLTGSRMLLTGAEPLTLDLCGADLSGVTISGSRPVSLKVDKNTNLDKATLTEATIVDSDLRQASLSGVSFFKSSLQRLTFAGTPTEVTFSRTSLGKVVFTDVTLLECPFLSAIGVDCNFDNAKFAGVGNTRQSSLEKAAFTKSSFLDAEFGEASLSAAQFVGCDLRRVKGWVVDNTVVRDSVHSSGAKDVWSTLRRRYTGANMVFNLIAMLIFFIPFIFQVLYWSGFNRAQRAASDVAIAVESAASAASTPQRSEAVSAAVKALVAPRMHECLDSHVGDAVRSEPSCLPVWKLLLGLHEEGYLPILFSCSLLVYNLARLFLTWRVAPLRDEEQSTFHSPGLSSYGWMIYFHRLVSGLFFLAIGSAVVHFGRALVMPIWVGVVQPNT